MTREGKGSRVDNPRKEELRQALNRARGVSGTLPDVLRAAREARDAGAWTGGTSDDFFAELTTRDTNAGTAGDAAVEVVRAAYQAEPATLPDPED